MLEAVQVMVGAVRTGADQNEVGVLATYDSLQVKAVQAEADQVKKVGRQNSRLCR